MSYLPPCRQAFFNSTAATAAAGTGGTSVPWVVKPGTINDDLLDLTDPLEPVVRQAGFYLVSGFFIFAGEGRTGGVITLEVALDYEGEEPSVRVSANWDDDSTVGFSVGYYIPAGGALKANINNGLDVSADVWMTAWLVRLSV